MKTNNYRLNNNLNSKHSIMTADSEYNPEKDQTYFLQKLIISYICSIIYLLFNIEDDLNLSRCWAADNSIYLDTNCSEPSLSLSCATLQPNWIPHVLLIRQVYVFVCLAFLSLLFFFSACRKGLKHTHTHTHTQTR